RAARPGLGRARRARRLGRRARRERAQSAARVRVRRAPRRDGRRARQGRQRAPRAQGGGGAMRRSVIAVAAAGLTALAGAAPAAASWGRGAELISVDWPRLEQADGSTNAVDVSADGRYVVFQTRATNFFADDDPDPAGRIRKGGVFRYDRATRALTLVADGD